MQKDIHKEFVKQMGAISAEGQARVVREEKLISVLKNMVTEVRAGLDNERKERQASEESMLTLLE